MTAVEMRLLLSRMEGTCRETRKHLDLIERQIEGRATRLALTDRIKKRSVGRSLSPWTPEDERRLQEHVDRLRFERRGELDALSRKLARQETAITVLCARRLQRSRSARGGGDLIPAVRHINGDCQVAVIGVDGRGG